MIGPCVVSIPCRACVPFTTPHLCHLLGVLDTPFSTRTLVFSILNSANVLCRHCSAWQPPWKACAIGGVRNQIPLRKSTRNFYKPAYSARVGGSNKDLWYVFSFLLIPLIPLGFSFCPKVTFMANITTFYASLNTADFRQKPTTSFLATM